jgi:HEAT repeat protein
MLEDEVPEVRLSAAEQLGSLGDSSGAMVVLEYLINTDQKDEKGVVDMRNAIAALAIGQIGDAKLIEYLPKLLKSDSPAVRLAASKSVFILAAVSSNLP